MMNFEFADLAFPTTGEIKRAADKFVAETCGGQWPEDEWFDIGDQWSVNIFTRSSERQITVYRYPSPGAELDTLGGINIDLP